MKGDAIGRVLYIQAVNRSARYPRLYGKQVDIALYLNKSIEFELLKISTNVEIIVCRLQGRRETILTVALGAMRHVRTVKDGHR